MSNEFMMLLRQVSRGKKPDIPYLKTPTDFDEY